MQFAQIAVFIASAVIVNAIRQIAVLLNFIHETPRADGMHGACRNKIMLALFYGIKTKFIGKRVFFYRFFALLFRYGFPEAEVNSRALFRFRDVPHFGFSVAVVIAQRVFVGGVHLHGKILRGVDEFHQHGESIERRCVGAEFGGGSRFFQRFAVCKPRFSVGMIRNFPAFRAGALFRLLAVFFHKFHSAPQIIFTFGI